MNKHKKLTKIQKLQYLYWDVKWEVFSFFVKILERLFGVVK